MAEEKNTEPGDAISPDRPAVGVIYNVPEGTPLEPADLLVVQASTERGLFYLSFFQSRIPLPNEPEDGMLTADCVSRLVLTPHILAKIIDLLEKNFQLFAKQIKAAAAQAVDGKNE